MSGDSNQPTVLIVEDNEDNRAIYRVMLAYAGYRVLEAADGNTGVAIARRDLPDLILMDLSMPQLSGYDAARALKGDRATAGIPILAVTAHALAGDREKAIEAGCDDYLAKPIEPRELLNAVNTVLGR